MDWLDLAKKLRVGGTARITCTQNCGTDHSMLVSSNEKSWTAHCFRCKHREYKSKGLLPLSLIKQMREDKYFTKSEVKLPHDFTLNVPDSISCWYLKYGISPELAREHNIGYSYSLNRVVIPVYNYMYDGDKDPIGIQARSVDPKAKPKYINKVRPDLHIPYLYDIYNRDSYYVVVVEDILSAIKVSKVHKCVSIMGTNMTHSIAAYLAKRYNHVILWFDSDKAGIDCSNKSMKLLNIHGASTRIVRTGLDPKEHSLDDIRRHVSNSILYNIDIEVPLKC